MGSVCYDYLIIGEWQPLNAAAWGSASRLTTAKAANSLPQRSDYVQPFAACLRRRYSMRMSNKYLDQTKFRASQRVGPARRGELPFHYPRSSPPPTPTADLTSPFSFLCRTPVELLNLRPLKGRVPVVREISTFYEHCNRLPVLDPFGIDSNTALSTHLQEKRHKADWENLKMKVITKKNYNRRNIYTTKYS